MTRMIDADTILKRAEPLVHQYVQEIQPYGHLIRRPIALSEVTCKESVESLNQLLAHEIVIEEARTMARIASERGDDGTNDLIVSEIIRTNELQAWFFAEQVVPLPLTHAL